MVNVPPETVEAWKRGEISTQEFRDIVANAERQEQIRDPFKVITPEGPKSVPIEQQTPTERLTGYSEGTIVNPYVNRGSKAVAPKPSLTPSPIPEPVKIPKPVVPAPSQETQEDIGLAETEAQLQSRISPEPERARDELREVGMGPFPYEAPTDPYLQRRVISGQETVSIESEAQRREFEKIGLSQIEGPSQQSRDLSYSIFGEPEAMGPDTVPKIISSSAEFFITLPAETVRSGVTVSEAVSQARTLGPERFARETVSSISKDPYTKGTQAALSVGLIALPVGRAVISRIPGRAVTVTEIAPQVSEGLQIRGGIAQYGTEAAYLQRGGITYGRGTTKIKYTGTQESAAVTTDTITYPRGEKFITISESRIAEKSRIDLTRPSAQRDITVSRTTPEGVEISRSEIISSRDIDQTNLLGERIPKTEEFVSERTTIPQNEFTSISIGATEGRAKTIDIGAQSLLEEAKTDVPGLGKVTARRTGSIEAFMEQEDFLKLTGRDRPPAGLGEIQETVRGFEPTGRIPSREPSITAAESSMLANVRRFTEMRIQLPKPREISPSVSEVRAVTRTTPTTRPVIRTTSLDTTGFETTQQQQFGLEPGVKARQRSGFDAISLYETEQAQETQGIEELTGLSQREGMISGQKSIYDTSQAQKPLQEQNIGLISLQATDLMVSTETQLRASPIKAPPRVRPPREPPILRPRPPLKPPKIPVLIPPIAAIGGISPPKKKKKKKIRQERETYAPSLSGLALGSTISKPPKGPLTGLELRPVVKRRRK